MKALEFLDIHTHRRAATDGVVGVECLSKAELENGYRGSRFISVGIHPWWVEDFPEDIDALKKHIEVLLAEGAVWAIGETGIDRAYPEFLDFQKELFLWHLRLSEKYQLPLVIHNVRASADFLGIIKAEKPTSPWIFHDFRGNETMMRDLLRLHPQSYFSFGLSIDNSPQIRELLPVVPLEHLFLETDNQKHLDIEDIYVRASEFIKIDLDFLKSQIWLNFKKISRGLSQN
jgi:TatD DNase family protein